MTSLTPGDDPSASFPGDAGRVIGGVDILDVRDCPGLAVRRTGRLATQIYDAHLQQTGLTIGQFGVMAQVYGVSLVRAPMTMRALSDLLAMDPTTLNRTLKPLEAQGLVRTVPDPEDRRARCVELTASGRERLAAAMPSWRAADDELRRTIGAETAVALSALLSLANDKLRDSE